MAYISCKYKYLDGEHMVYAKDHKQGYLLDPWTIWGPNADNSWNSHGVTLHNNLNESLVYLSECFV